MVVKSRKPSLSLVQGTPHSCLTTDLGRGLKEDSRLVNDVAWGGSKLKEDAHRHKTMGKYTEAKTMMMEGKTQNGCLNDRVRKWMEKSKKYGK